MSASLVGSEMCIRDSLKNFAIAAHIYPEVFRRAFASRKEHQDPNLPGWCWARIKQLALIGSSSSLHSEACKALGGSDGVIHSRISDSGGCVRADTNCMLHTHVCSTSHNACVGAAQGSLLFRSAHPHVILRKNYVLIVPAIEAITAFTSLRTNLSPFTKGCRERDASM